jgi:hypothetical protein
METFYCNKCSSDVLSDEWYYSVRGRDSMCKSCRKAYRKDAKRQYTAQYVKDNPEAHRQRMKEWRERNPDYQKKWSKNCPESQLLRSARYRAKQNGIECTITQADIIIPDICPVFKVPLQKNTPYAPSIDRYDSTKGYTPDNIVVMSRRANVMKNDGTLAEHKMLVQWMSSKEE